VTLQMWRTSKLISEAEKTVSSCHFTSIITINVAVTKTVIIIVVVYNRVVIIIVILTNYIVIILVNLTVL
jgi:hypothetical protein